MPEEKFEVIIVPSFQEDIDRMREGEHLELIYKSFEKIERLGKNALKILYIRGRYVLGEIKFMSPPYRLYVIVNQEDEKFFIVRWEHKEKQERVINYLKEKLQYAFEHGIKNIAELFSK